MAVRRKIVAGELHYKDINFHFRVIAYRKMSVKELEFHLDRWLAENKKRKPPKNRFVTYETIFGLQGGAF